MSEPSAAVTRGYLVLMYGLLAVIVIRGFWWREANWDLLGLIVVSGAVSSWKSPVRPKLGGSFWLTMAATGLLAAIIAAGMSLLRR